MVLLAVLCGAAAAFIGAYSLFGATNGALPERLNRLERGGLKDRPDLLAEPFTARVGKVVIIAFRLWSCRRRRPSAAGRRRLRNGPSCTRCCMA